MTPRRRARVIDALLRGEDYLVQLPPLPDWMADAACREHPEITWFPGPGSSGLDAMAVCNRCLVQAECLRYALDHDLEGIWGGTTVRQRRRLVQRQGYDRWQAREGRAARRAAAGPA